MSEESQGQRFSLKGVISLLVLCSLSAWILLSFGSPQPLADQLDLLGVGRGPVRWDNGILSVLLVKAMRVFDRSDAALNEAVRLLALGLYLISSYALGCVALKKPNNVPIFLVFLLVSRFPFLWNSKEVFTGVFFNLAFLSIAGGYSPFFIGLLVSLAGFGKPETLLFGVILLVFLAKNTLGTKRRGALLFGFLCPFFLSTFLLQTNETSSDGVERARLSLAQHYGVLVFKHQCCFADTRDEKKQAEFEENDFRSASTAKRDPLLAWRDSEFLEGPLVEGRKSLPEIVRRNYRVYLDFVALAFVQSMLNLFLYCPFVLLLLGLRLQRARGPELPLAPLEKVFFISLLGFLPYFFLSFLHVRFLARIAPLAIVVLFNWYENERNRRYRLVLGLFLLVAFFWWATPMIQELQAITPQKLFWWPD